ncbi:MAG: hypothetical protein JWP08_2711 [Bryobacterales bacterium]|nr:hypothetical protein [Bryobacterales bacterium]
MAIVLLSIDRAMLVEHSYATDEIKKARQSSPGLVIRQKEPNNLGDEGDAFFTPPELFYIRGQFRGAEVTPRFLTAHRWCGQESVLSQLPGIANLQNLQILPSFRQPSNV